MGLPCLALALASHACSDEPSAPPPPPDASVTPFDVVTHHYDNARTGANLDETLLTTSDVGSLHPIYSAKVDGEIYAQPLVVHGVVTGGAPRDLLLVATMEDTVFAFDANDGAPVWSQHLGTPAFSERNVGGDNGILSTPVVDPAAGAMYVVARDCNASAPPTAPDCAQRLFALDLRDGSTRSAIAITGGAPGKTGTVAFDPNAHWNRPALLLDFGRVFVAFGAGPNGSQHEEDFVYHGWVFAYDASDFTAAPWVFCATPSGQGGGIWQSGAGLASDGKSVYFVTGNATIGSSTNPPSTFPASPAGYEDSIVRLTPPTGPAAPTLASYWDGRPYHADGDVFQYMESHDVDFGSGGPLLVPDSPSLVAGAKSGIFYDIDRDTMQQTTDPLVLFTNPPLDPGQSLHVYSWAGNPTVNGGPAFWRPDGADSGFVYAWPKDDYLKATRYDYASQSLEAAPALTASVSPASTGGMLSVSANGGAPGTGIVWALADVSGGHLFAFDATTLEKVWDTAYPHYAKFVPPVVADGKVFVASSAPGASDGDEILVFGL